jgi:mRNA-degrading endonuclease YafQ of YafQ-DinJ toxin-antitoxin module
MHVQRTERFEKSLEILRRGDGRATLAARNAEGIIRALAAGDLSTVNHKLTGNGEARLEKAVKFDLGSGYRLVSVRCGDALLMLYAGSHDDCDRWLERNRGVSFGVEEMVRAATSPSEGTATTLQDWESQKVEGEKDYGHELSQKELRLIFRGLCGG